MTDRGNRWETNISLVQWTNDSANTGDRVEALVIEIVLILIDDMPPPVLTVRSSEVCGELPTSDHLAPFGSVWLSLVTLWRCWLSVGVVSATQSHTVITHDPYEHYHRIVGSLFAYLLSVPKKASLQVYAIDSRYGKTGSPETQRITRFPQKFNSFNTYMDLIDRKNQKLLPDSRAEVCLCVSEGWPLRRRTWY